ncbi:amidohydrolase family protein [Kitasatospora sp. NPDC101235]|uniref:amidohydrolase family protein n=1 Tax=Kitasatospora sp. NPDC101235 TaxID=3364101 RepID=UPI00381AA849
MHDLIISGGEVHDGFASDPVTADVAVTADRVIAVGKDLGAARRTIDETGLVTAPGFVDPHSHSDSVPFLPDAQPFKLMQGVTTEVVGNCGFSLPPEACEGNVDALRARLLDPQTRAAIRATAEGPGPGTGGGLWREVHPEDMQILRHTDPSVKGRRLADVPAGREPWDVLCELLIADPHAYVVCHTMDEGDVRAIMADPLVAIGSDSDIPIGPNHPRTFGTFPTFLGGYVRDGGVVDLAEAIRKVTSATASRFGLSDRGWIGRGSVADLVVFDPARIGHAGTYEHPELRPTGMTHVFLAGEQVIADGEFTGERRGRMLRSERR